MVERAQLHQILRTRQQSLLLLQGNCSEYINCGKTIYSRVARVCKDDQGGQRVLQNRWTTYMKARLNCSVPGEYPFYFDEIQAMTDLIQVGDSYRMYAVFTTPQNSISGSAVCAFDMENITEAFDGKYKEQETTQSTWLPVPPNRVPSPRPGNCVNNSKLVPDTTLNFMKTHPLMDSAVGAWGGEPLFIKTGSARFTSIAVDTEAGIGNHLVMFIGTNTGKVLKILYVDGKQRKVMQVPLARCQRYSSCRSCVKAQDPYCGWSGDNNDCREAVSSNTLQDVINGDHTSFSGYTCSGFSDYGGKLWSTVAAIRVPSLRRLRVSADLRVSKTISSLVSVYYETLHSTANLPSTLCSVL
ncbi:Semaphorin-6A [Branchiostoma belcheri]|nr:Semaphorin-6A [Branchiostoma belcheri]